MRVVLGFVALLCALPVFAVDVAGSPAPDSSAEYQRIAELRAREMANFKVREAACYERFAVNDCLNKLQSPHRALLGDLKRQETRLHDRERAQQGAEQLQHAEQKAQEKKQADEQADAAAATAHEKLQAQRAKQAAHAVDGAYGAGISGAASPSGPGTAERAANTASYVAKQAAAEKKRQEIAKRLRDKQSTKPVPPLPVPP
jgi:hypothetical protein